MTFRSCGRGEEVVAMLRRGHGPNVGDEELRAHIQRCAQCSERVLLAQSFLEARRESFGTAPLGNSQALWWRAQLRQRDAVLRQVRWPVTLAQIFALMVGVIVAGGFLIAAWSRGGNWLTFGDAAELLAGARADVASFLALFGPANNLLLASGLGAVALLGGVVYLASDKQ
ncbi:MAG TPA: hypothetical protein VHP11_00010 [Tepidisphaeraceae bacterium]|nr:hypothetical protein [Tepidisphaeraceae bacterium]